MLGICKEKSNDNTIIIKNIKHEKNVKNIFLFSPNLFKKIIL